MSRIVNGIGVVVGLAAVLVVYVAFVACEFVKAGRSNAALGVGVFPYVITRSAFLVCAAAAFALAFYAVIRR